MSSTFTIDGFEGTWHHVMYGSFIQMAAAMVKAGTHTETQAKDLLRSGDFEFSAHNPKTGKTETYAVLDQGGPYQMLRKLDTEHTTT